MCVCHVCLLFIGWNNSCDFVFALLGCIRVCLFKILREYMFYAFHVLYSHREWDAVFLFITLWITCFASISGSCMLVCKATFLIVFVHHRKVLCRSYHKVRISVGGTFWLRDVLRLLDLWIISCWLGCSQDLSFVLCLNICLNVWGSWERCLSVDSVLRCRTRVGADVTDLSLTWWARY